jgi:orotate phosphoribosyltransferase-like protein
MARRKRTKQESRALRDKIAELKKQGRLAAEIASELDVTRQYVYSVLIQAGLAKGTGRKRTNKESLVFKAKIAKLKKQGGSGAEIARELGVTKQYVSLVLTQAGLADVRRPSVPRKPKEFRTERIATISQLEQQGETILSEMLRATLDRRRGKKDD